MRVALYSLRFHPYWIEVGHISHPWGCSPHWNQDHLSLYGNQRVYPSLHFCNYNQNHPLHLCNRSQISRVGISLIFSNYPLFYYSNIIIIILIYNQNIALIHRYNSTHEEISSNLTLYHLIHIPSIYPYQLY
jgi:hypothetical protein